MTPCRVNSSLQEGELAEEDELAFVESTCWIVRQIAAKTPFVDHELPEIVT